MRLIHCTAKLLKELKNPTLHNPDTTTSEGLGNWYANLLRFDRRKCILFTNEKTFYSFMIAGVKKENLQNIFDEFLFHLNMNLQAEGFGIDAISKVMAEYTDMGLAKTSNRQVLGVMNDFAFGYEYFIYREGGLNRVRILEANRRTNRTPSSPLKYHFPIDMIWMLLTGEKAPRPLRD